MAVKRVILQQFSMQLNYMNKERSNIYQPSVKVQNQQQQHSVDSNFMTPLELPSQMVQSQPQHSLTLGSDGEPYDDKHDESCDSPPTTPSETSDEEIRTILDNVRISNNINNIMMKCDDNKSCGRKSMNDSPLQSRRRPTRPLFIMCPTPSG